MSQELDSQSKGELSIDHLAGKLRSFILTNIPNAKETILENSSIYRVRNNICYIQKNGKSVRFGFFGTAVQTSEDSLNHSVCYVDINSPKDIKPVYASILQSIASA